MATNLQVNANTQQAANAFNALAASIANAQQALNGLQNSAQQFQSTTANRFSGGMNSVGSAFDRLQGIASGLLETLKKVGAGVELFFTAIVRELDKLQGFNAIMMVSTKNAADSASSYEFLRKTADRLGVQFDALAGNYAKLVAAVPDGVKKLETAQSVFLGIAMAARTLHATNQDTQLMFYAVTQMASKGIVSMEELRRQLGEKLPGVIQIAARALNTLPETLEASIRKGVVSSEKFLPIFGDALVRTFADSSEQASKSVSASLNRLTNVWVDFVKVILDSGAGQSIANIFDAIRQKLEDPYVISRFAELVKYVGDRFADFVNKLTAEDIRNGFDTFTHAVEVLITLLGKVVDILTWVINNGGKVGAIIGGLAGASAGAVAGPWGMAAGGLAGAAAGAYAGNSLTANSPAEDLAKLTGDLKASQDKANLVADRQLVMYQMLIPTLQQFKGLQNLDKVQGLFKPENLTRDMVGKLVDILGDKRFKTDADRANAAVSLSKFGYVISPANATLNDVLGAGKPNKAYQKALDASEMRADGFNPNFLREWTNYLTLLKQGKLSIDQVEEAQRKLLEQQPFMKERTKDQAELNKQTSDMITLVLEQVSAREKLTRSLQDELTLSNLTGNERALEEKYRAQINELAQHGVELSSQEAANLRETNRLILQRQQLSAVKDQINAETVDKYNPQIQMRQALKEQVANPSSGIDKQTAEQYIVSKDPNGQGTQAFLDAQKKALVDYYSFVDGLRQDDLISEQTAIQMKQNAEMTYQEARLGQASTFFGNLATLAKSGNSKLAAVGKAAAIAQATIDGILAVQKALASAPPPYSYALAAAAGVAAAANVAQIISTKTYYNGGYTGGGATGQVAGIVHGQEYVVNASATARNRATLDAMNSGATINTRSGGANIEIHNYGTSKTFEKQELDDGRIRIIARDEAEAVMANNLPSAMAQQLSDPNSRSSKILSRTTTTERKR